MYDRCLLGVKRDPERRHIRVLRNQYFSGNASLAHRTTACTGRLNNHFDFYCPGDREVRATRGSIEEFQQLVLGSDNIIEFEGRVKKERKNGTKVVRDPVAGPAE